MKKSFLILALCAVFVFIGCGGTDDDSDTDSTASEDYGKDDESVIPEFEHCDEIGTYSCRTDPADGKEKSYLCWPSHSHYGIYEECKAGCNASTGKCNPWTDPESGITWSFLKKYKNDKLAGMDPNLNDDKGWGWLFEWEEARSYCSKLKEGGFNDWRLPTIDELRTLIQNCPATETGGKCKVSEKNDCLDSHDECYSPADCTCRFDSTGKYSRLGDGNIWLWSHSELPGQAWIAGFGYASVLSDGKSGGTTNFKTIRCVR